MKQLSWPAAFAAILIGLLLSTLIWVCQPYNDFLLANSSVAGTYLPSLGVALVMILAGLINPLLKWLAPGFSLSMKQLALIFGIVLVSGTSLSMISQWHYALAGNTAEISKTKLLADAHKDMELPESLYLEPPVYGAETPVSTQLIEDLEEGNQIPWQNWLAPAKSWGVMLVFSIILMVGLGLIVYPQWRENERLPFPLLSVQQALIETSKGEKRFPPLFRNGLFWFGFLLVFLIYLFKGLNYFTGEAVPGFPTSWAFWGILERGITGHMHWWVMAGGMIFMIIGITYFVPSRISFSIWFTVLGYQVYQMLGYAYMAPFHGRESIGDHRTGALFGVALVVIWLGRLHWIKVVKAMFISAKTDEDSRNRSAGLIFLTGCIGLFGWQMWAGNSIPYAILVVMMMTVTSLVLARIVAETGLPLMGNSVLVGPILKLMPITWLSAKSIYLTNVMDLVMGEVSSKLSATVTSMHGIGLDKELNPKSQARWAKGFILVMVLGMVVAALVHLSVGYNNRGTLVDYHSTNVKTSTAAINNAVNTPMKAYLRESWEPPAHNRIAHTIFGFLAAIGMQIGCLLSPIWPIHPVGLLIMDTAFIRGAWWSVMIGWLIKRSIVTYGGAKAYRIARPIFFGMILAEVFSALLWAIVPALLIYNGGDATEIGKIQVGP